MRYLLLLFVSFLYATHLFSQTFVGKVTDKDKNPLPGATVVAMAEGQKIVAYGIAGKDGSFSLTVPEGKAVSQIHVNSVGYKQSIVPFSAFKNGMHITLSEGGFQLKEVKVKARRIESQGDTLTYSVAGFKQAQDRSLADVISKMPGLEVKSDGSVEYQGKAINKFYIEGVDLMGAQYGMANRNLPAVKVKSVQVLKNHQNIKSLRGVSFSDQAALNILLEDNAKAVWTGTADIGLGYGNELLYDCRLMGMKFNKGFQSLLMYKNNSTGNTLGGEVLDLAALLNNRMAENGILGMPAASSPGLARNRYTFNHSHLLAGNCLWKTGENSELRLQLNGYLDKTEITTRQTTSYLTIEGLPVMLEQQDATNTSNEWKGELNYQYNGEKTYIRNNLKTYVDFDKSSGEISCNEQQTKLFVKPRKRSLAEDFQLSHTAQNGNVYKLNSYWTYNYLPGQLLTIGGNTEKLDLGFFSSQNDVEYKIKTGSHYLNNKVGVNYDNQRIAVSFDNAQESAGVYSLLLVYWQQSIAFLFGKHHLDIAIRESYARQSYRQSKSSHFMIDPSLKWKWKASTVSDFSASVMYANSPLRCKAIYDIPLFTDYNTTMKNRGKTDMMHVLSASAAYEFSNPVAGVFFNVGPSCSLSSGNILYKSSLQDNVYSVTATDKDYMMRSLGLSAKISKSFSWAKTFVALGVSHDVIRYSMLVGDELNNARMNSTYVSLDYSLRPLRQLSIEGQSEVNIRKQQNRTQANLSPGSTVAWEHSLQFHVFPASKWMISVANELFHSNQEGVDLSYFLDLALSYKAKRWELALKADNIIGSTDFERRLLANSFTLSSVTRLRPREFLLEWSVDL